MFLQRISTFCIENIGKSYSFLFQFLSFLRGSANVKSSENQESSENFAPCFGRRTMSFLVKFESSVLCILVA